MEGVQGKEIYKILLLDRLLWASNDALFFECHVGNERRFGADSNHGFFLIEFYVANFECPRCGNKFFKKKRKLFALASWGQCVHCDLKLYEGSKYKWSLIG